VLPLGEAVSGADTAAAGPGVAAVVDGHGAQEVAGASMSA